MRKKVFFLLFLIILFMTAYVSSEKSSSSINWLSKKGAEALFCLRDGDCTLDNLTVQNLQVQGEVFNVSVVNYNVTGNIGVEGNISADYFIGDGSLLTNLSTELTYTDPSQSSSVAGTISGTLDLVSHNDTAYDSVTLNITEVATSPGLDVRMNFTSIVDFAAGLMRYRTSDLKGDLPVIQLYDEDDDEWEDYSVVGESATFSTIFQNVFDTEEHITDGVVQMRLYKSSNGNTQNTYYIDWIALVHGDTLLFSSEVDPFSIHTDAINTTDFYYDGHLNLNYTSINVTLNISGGDNLGDHVATEDLDMSAYDINNVKKQTFQSPLIFDNTNIVYESPNHVNNSLCDSSLFRYSISPTFPETWVINGGISIYDTDEDCFIFADCWSGYTHACLYFSDNLKYQVEADMCKNLEAGTNSKSFAIMANDSKNFNFHIELYSPAGNCTINGTAPYLHNSPNIDYGAFHTGINNVTNQYSIIQDNDKINMFIPIDTGQPNFINGFTSPTFRLESETLGSRLDINITENGIEYISPDNLNISSYINSIFFDNDNQHIITSDNFYIHDQFLGFRYDNTNNYLNLMSGALGSENYLKIGTNAYIKINDTTIYASNLQIGEATVHIANETINTTGSIYGGVQIASDEIVAETTICLNENCITDWSETTAINHTDINVTKIESQGVLDIWV